MSRLFVQNYIKKTSCCSTIRLPNDVDRCNLERHLSDNDFELIFECTRNKSHLSMYLTFFLYLSLYFDNPFIDFCIYISLCQNIWLIFELKIENFVFAKVRLLPPSTLEAKRSEEASQTFLNDGKVKGSSKKAAKPVENYSKSQRIE